MAAVLASNLANNRVAAKVADFFGSGGGLDKAPKRPTSKKKTKEIASIDIAEDLQAEKRTALPANFNNLNNNAQNVASSSLILPPEFPIELEGMVRRKWRELCSGQVFNGDLLERDFLVYVTRNGPSRIIDIDRYEATSSGSYAFMKIVQMRPAGRTMFFKSNFDLKRVNSFQDVFASIRKPARGKTAAINKNVTWAEVKTMTKGKDNVQPDVLIWEWNGRSAPILNIIEMKAGFGEAGATDSNPTEYIQLCRCKRLFEHWLDQLEAAIRNSLNNPHVQKIKKILNSNVAGGWRRPEIKLWFVGFAATSQTEISFGKPGKVWTLAQPVPYNVGTLTGVEFGTKFGIAVNFINEAVAELNQFRRTSLEQTIAKFQQPPPIGDATLHAKYLKAIENKKRTMRAHVRSSGVTRAPVEYLGNNGNNVESFAGMSNFLSGKKGAKLTAKAKKNTAAKLKKARNERVKSASKPQAVRMRIAGKLANVLLEQYAQGRVDPLTGNLNNNAARAIQNAAEGNADLVKKAKARAAEIDPNFAGNNLAAERFKNSLLNNVMNAGGLFSQQ
jgi:hypothetical protein